jgi:hypothetical protein
MLRDIILSSKKSVVKDASHIQVVLNITLRGSWLKNGLAQTL